MMNVHGQRVALNRFIPAIRLIMDAFGRNDSAGILEGRRDQGAGRYSAR
ncbi:MAG TPA: hypothetical protein VKZ91_03205 [Woeseiaceae bacterium]|nr:hypothetical protein [Woeseiaceae bacterium]